ncbi:MAG: DegT/DnrJ/EryC1/StrS family aminotransferase, partial [Dehalococcoidales bacterium]|nr:DegT/DnrJ/EryC1/StrS family aminotransferase [Dehalococcoidales bacterium]
MSIGKEERDAAMRVFDRGILSGYRGCWDESFYGGEEVRALEGEWAAYFGVKHAIVCNSATSGLYLACAAIGLQNPLPYHKIYNCIDDRYIPEIICSPWSMTCSASIPLHFGAKPVFSDIEEDYFCLDPKAVEAKITHATKAIIVVDLFGCPYAADEINAIAKKHGIYVIEDAAQAVGATYKGKYAGTLGDIGVFSLNVNKHISCGEGGVVVTNDDELAMRLRLAMNHAEAVTNGMQENEIVAGTWATDYYDMVGLNLRMTELQAAVTREQLKKLAGILEVVRDQAKYFDVKVRPGC